MTLPPEPPPPPPPPPGWTPPPSGMPAPPGMPGTLAEWPMRALGAVIDGAIIAVPYLILLKIVPILGILYYVGAFLYLRQMEGTTGQTFGKQVAKIKVVKEADGQVLGFGLAIGRSLLHILDLLPCFIGFLFPLWDPKKQTFADKIVQTVVVTV